MNKYNKIEDNEINPTWGLDKKKGDERGRIFLTRNGFAVDCPFRDIRCTTLCRCFKIFTVPCKVEKVDGTDTNVVTHVDIMVNCLSTEWRSEVVVGTNVPVGEI